MADRYLLEISAVDGYLLEDGLGVLLLEVTITDDLATKLVIEQNGIMAVSGG